VTIYNAIKSGGTAKPLQVAVDDQDKNKGIYLSFYFQQNSDSFVIQYTFFEKQ
jgi:hypothetical protein